MRVFLTGVALSVLITGSAVAQDSGMMPPPPPGGERGPGGPPPMMPPLKRVDVPAMVAKHFAMMDLNHDGVLDDADRVAMVAERRADRVAEMKAHRDRMFAALDANKDGAISREEFDAAPRRAAIAGRMVRAGLTVPVAPAQIAWAAPIAATARTPMVPAAGASVVRTVPASA